MREKNWVQGSCGFFRVLLVSWDTQHGNLPPLPPQYYFSVLFKTLDSFWCPCIKYRFLAVQGAAASDFVSRPISLCRQLASVVKCPPEHWPLQDLTVLVVEYPQALEATSRTPTERLLCSQSRAPEQLALVQSLCFPRWDLVALHLFLRQRWWRQRGDLPSVASHAVVALSAVMPSNFV